MKMILEQASNSARCDVVEIDTLNQVLKLSEGSPTDPIWVHSMGVVITTKSLLNQSHDDPDIKWHITIYDGYIE